MCRAEELSNRCENDRFMLICRLGLPILLVADFIDRQIFLFVISFGRIRQFGVGLKEFGLYLSPRFWWSSNRSINDRQARRRTYRTDGPADFTEAFITFYYPRYRIRDGRLLYQLVLDVFDVTVRDPYEFLTHKKISTSDLVKPLLILRGLHIW